MPRCDKHVSDELFRFMTGPLELKPEDAAGIIAGNDDHRSVLEDIYTCACFNFVPPEELPNFVAELFRLNAPNCLDAITKIAGYVLSVRERVSKGMKDMDVQHCGQLVLELAVDLDGHKRKLIHEFIFRFGVTVQKLRDPAGSMEVFPHHIQLLIKSLMPTVPALLDHVLEVVNLNPALEKRPDPSATRKRDREDTPEVLDEPDEAALRCDENLDDEPSTPTAPPRSAEQEHEWRAQMCMAPLPKSARALTSS